LRVQSREAGARGLPSGQGIGFAFARLRRRGGAEGEQRLRRRGRPVAWNSFHAKERLAWNQFHATDRADAAVRRRSAEGAGGDGGDYRLVAAAVGVGADRAGRGAGADGGAAAGASGAARGAGAAGARPTRFIASRPPVSRPASGIARRTRQSARWIPASGNALCDWSWRPDPYSPAAC